MIKDDIKKLKLFYEHDYSTNKYSKITSFSNFDAVYRWTNEEIKLYPKDNLSNKKVLTITSSGDHILEAVLCGSKNIDSIDINIFSKYYSALKIAMIKKYDCYDFFDKMYELILFGTDKEGIKKIIDEISIYLTADEIKFWQAYADICFNNMFFGGMINSDKNEYSSSRIYNILKDKIDDVNIKYYDGDIFNISEILEGKKYDYIYLSNVLERITTRIASKKRMQKKTIQKLTGHLNNNGSIYNYFLGFQMINLDEMFGRYINSIEKKYDIIYYYDNESEYPLNKGIIRLNLK